MRAIKLSRAVSIAVYLNVLNSEARTSVQLLSTFCSIDLGIINLSALNYNNYKL
jgi:hypothetical protein